MARAVGVRRILALARPELPLLTGATLALFVSSGITLLFPTLAGWLVDLVSTSNDPAQVDRVALGLVGLFAVGAVFGLIRAWWFTVAGERVVARLRRDLFGHLLRQEIGFFDATRTGELTNRLASDTTVLQNAVTVNLSMALRFGLTVVGGIVMMAYTSPMLTGVALAVVPFVAIGGSVFGRWIRRISEKVQDALARSTEVAEEALSGVRTVRSFAAEDAEIARYDRAVDESYRLAAQRALAYGGFQGIAGLAGNSALALVVWWGGRMVLAGDLSLGALTSFLLYTLMVAVAIATLAGLYGDFMKALGASKRVFELLDREGGLEATGGDVPPRLTGAIALREVSFAYPTRPDAPVLRGLDLTITPGEVVAVVGPSGAGKSTIASLLLRFYDPTSGRIEVDGLDLASLDPSSVRRMIGVVQQEPVLFATTIADNIRYGRRDASDEDVAAAARAAHAAEFIEGFPEGYATSVGERGVRLSGGQKQRVAIARALLEDPAILVLDEATSALDAENEHLVQEALDRLMRGRTTLVIAHRLSTIRNADRVVVLDEGQIAEVGTHDELLATEDGLYKRLTERQLT